MIPMLKLTVEGRRLWAIAFLCTAISAAQKPENVLVVVNEESALSKTVGEYYVLRRHIPLANVCRIHAPALELIRRDVYDNQIAASVAACLKSKGLTETVLYIVTTAGVPLRVNGPGEGMETETAAVDSELALLYSEMHGNRHPLPGPFPNPFFGNMAAFAHPQFPIYLVTRLAGYDFADIKGLIDRALLAKNTGKFVIDLKQHDSTPGNEWLRTAARQLPKERVVLDDTSRVLTNERGVIAYASWGSNDPDRKQRTLGFEWLAGAIMTEYVSTNARTFALPPKEWTLGNWGDPNTWFAGAPQTMSADYIREGATGASGHVWEPFLTNTPRPDLLLPAYYKGRDLAESYYLSIPALSWQNIVIGDPLCSLGKP
jgi:uncharacterized protein (TIGR03790 family)